MRRCRSSTGDSVATGHWAVPAVWERAQKGKREEITGVLVRLKAGPASQLFLHDDPRPPSSLTNSRLR